MTSANFVQFKPGRRNRRIHFNIICTNTLPKNYITLTQHAQEGDTSRPPSNRAHRQMSEIESGHQASLSDSSWTWTHAQKDIRAHNTRTPDIV